MSDKLTPEQIKSAKAFLKLVGNFEDEIVREVTNRVKVMKTLDTEDHVIYGVITKLIKYMVDRRKTTI